MITLGHKSFDREDVRHVLAHYFSIRNSNMGINIILNLVCD